jgi:hypothetical protein
MDIKGQDVGFLALEMGPICCSETSVDNQTCALQQPTKAKMSSEPQQEAGPLCAGKDGSPTALVTATAAHNWQF